MNGLNSKWDQIRGDVVGGVTVAVVALPLALAFGIASGAGPAAGLYASIFAGLVTSIFGSCPTQVSGPTATMTLVLVSIVSKYGVTGMFLAGAMAGIMQLIMGVLRLGSFVKYLPRPVISGFTNGVAIIILLSQTRDAFQNPIVTVATIATIVLASRYAKRIPSSLFGLAGGILVNELFVHTPHVVGYIPSGLPRLSLPLLPLEQMIELIAPAFTICLLGTIETLLSAQVADDMTGKQSNSNRELIGQGLGNVVSGLVGGLPIAGVIARTTVNTKSGGKTRLSGIVHSSILLLIILVFGPWAQQIPLASLAAILIVTAVRMADIKSIMIIPRASWHYTAILLTTMILTVMQDLAIGVAAGVTLAVVFVIAELTALPLAVDASSKPKTDKDISSLHSDIEVVTLVGPISFVGTHRLMKQLGEESKGRILVLDCTYVPTIDESGIFMLKQLSLHLTEQQRRLYLAGLAEEPFRMLERLGLVNMLGYERVCIDVDTAVKQASQEAATWNTSYAPIENGALALDQE